MSTTKALRPALPAKLLPAIFTPASPIFVLRKNARALQFVLTGFATMEVEDWIPRCGLNQECGSNLVSFRTVQRPKNRALELFQFAKSRLYLHYLLTLADDERRKCITPPPLSPLGRTEIVTGITSIKSKLVRGPDYAGAGAGPLRASR